MTHLMEHINSSVQLPLEPPKPGIARALEIIGHLNLWCSLLYGIFEIITYATDYRPQPTMFIVAIAILIQGVVGGIFMLGFAALIQRAETFNSTLQQLYTLMAKQASA